MESKELSPEGGIALVSPEDRLKFNPTGDQFESMKKNVPNLGIVYLLGARIFNYDPEELGVTVIGDNVEIKSANELYDMGLFQIDINVDHLRTQTTCNMAIDKYGLSIKSDMDIVEDEVVAEGNSERYWGATDTWKIKGDDRKFHFFAPADPKFLSQLQFSFHADLPPTQS